MSIIRINKIFIFLVLNFLCIWSTPNKEGQQVEPSSLSKIKREKDPDRHCFSCFFKPKTSNPHSAGHSGSIFRRIFSNERKNGVMPIPIKEQKMTENMFSEKCSCGRIIGQEKPVKLNITVNKKIYTNLFYIDRRRRIMHGRNESGECYAIKTDCYSRNEIPAMQACKTEPHCQNVIEFVEVDISRQICILPFGEITIQQIFNQRSMLNYGLKCNLLRKEITKGIKQMHQKGWSHGDIKAENVMLFSQNAGYVIKLIDLGNAISLEDIKWI